jgi:type II secretory pathway pseudopilin PulG
MALQSHTRGRRLASRRSEDGYVLLYLLLIVALMIIAAAIIVPSVTFEIKRDREEELIHRGVQYTRAIRTYYKKFGRYPTRIEDLESANNLRFLRKRYKDPMTGKDFKLLHFGEVQLALGGGIGGGTIPGANPVGSPTTPNGSGGPGGLSGGSSFGGSTFGGNTLGGSGGAGSSPNSLAGQNPQNGSGQGSGTGGTGGTDPSAQGTGTPGPGSSNSTSSSGQLIGGGPIVGVASNAKCPPRPKDDCEGYREFNHKKKYSDWQFIYDPGTDRGGLPMTPNQPPLIGMGQGIPGATTPGAPVNGTNGTGTGFSPIGTQNNQNPPGNTGANPPAAPPAPTPQGNEPQ